jgi:hypothetical protein
VRRNLRAMTVRALRKALRGLPPDDEVTISVDMDTDKSCEGRRIFAALVGGVINHHTVVLICQVEEKNYEGHAEAFCVNDEQE